MTVRKLSQKLYRYCTGRLNYHASIVIVEAIMRHRSATESLSLQSGQLESYVFEEPTQLRITRGRVWLTVSGMMEDHWLSGGDTMDLPAHRQVVVEAHRMDSVLEFMQRQRKTGQASSCAHPVCVET